MTIKNKPEVQTTIQIICEHILKENTRMNEIIITDFFIEHCINPEYEHVKDFTIIHTLFNDVEEDSKYKI